MIQFMIRYASHSSASVNQTDVLTDALKSTSIESFES